MLCRVLRTKEEKPSAPAARGKAVRLAHPHSIGPAEQRGSATRPLLAPIARRHPRTMRIFVTTGSAAAASNRMSGLARGHARCCWPSYG